MGPVYARVLADVGSSRSLTTRITRAPREEWRMTRELVAASVFGGNYGNTRSAKMPRADEPPPFPLQP